MRAVVVILITGGALAALSVPQQETIMTVKRLTPIIFVAEIEPCLPFWTERLGFERTAEVPHDDRLGFVILQKDGTELMYQSVAGAVADFPPLAAHAERSSSTLFVEVVDVEAVAERLAGVEVVRPMRTTSYGARELFVRAPCGTVVGFAQFGAGE